VDRIVLSERVSVLIVSWNRAELLSACVESVRVACPQVQIVVVDNGSEPALAPIAGVTWVRSEVNRGFAGGNNLGLPHCSGEYLLLLNNDTLLPSSEPVETLVAFLNAHPQVAAAQAKLQLPDGTLDTCGEFLTPRGVLYHHGYRQPDGPHAQAPFPVYAAKAACCLVRKAALADVGDVLFRDDYFCYGEDLELCHRLWLSGHEVWFVPTSPVLHNECATSKLLPTRFVWRHYLSNLLTTACHYWQLRTWCQLGCGLLFLLVGGALLKGVFPHKRHGRIAFTRKRSDADLLARVVVRVSWRYVFACLRRRFNCQLFPLPTMPDKKA
jgi:GT2 family glycosyltransferase